MIERGSKKERAKDLAKDLAKEGLGAAKEATTESSSREDKGEGGCWTRQGVDSRKLQVPSAAMRS
jgi:hypothetical protein